MLPNTSRPQGTCRTKSISTRGTSQKAGTRTRSRPNKKTAAKACPATPYDAPAPYERRRPEETTLYHVVQDHVETFFAQVEQAFPIGLEVFLPSRVG